MCYEKISSLAQGNKSRSTGQQLVTQHCSADGARDGLATCSRGPSTAHRASQTLGIARERVATSSDHKRQEPGSGSWRSRVGFRSMAHPINFGPQKACKRRSTRGISGLFRVLFARQRDWENKNGRANQKFVRQVWRC